MPDRDRPRHILPTIVGAQFAGTSLWFAGNAVLGDLERDWQLGSSIGILTSAVQLGFIAGTLLFAVFTLADRFSPRRVFALCAVLGASANAAIVIAPHSLAALVALRVIAGVCLAGIYPVGMKIAASWYRERLGTALGWLVGALVLGTAFPHVLRAGGLQLPWREVLLVVSAIAATGGLVLFALVPIGPHLPARSKFDPHGLRKIFADREFRAAAFGYFGHMWELYAMWTLVPLLVAKAGAHDISLWSFAIIAAGCAGCVLGGFASVRAGSARVAAANLATSGLVCLLAPLVFALPTAAALAVLVVWGFAVVGDSPQFSTITAATAPRELVGTALASVTCIGFLITIPSIQLATWLAGDRGVVYACLVLAIGPLLGLAALRRLVTASSSTR